MTSIKSCNTKGTETTATGRQKLHRDSSYTEKNSYSAAGEDCKTIIVGLLDTVQVLQMIKTAHFNLYFSHVSVNLLLLTIIFSRQ